VDRYVDGKSDFILSILARHGFPAGSLDSIRRANRLKCGPLVIRSASSTRAPGLLHRRGQRGSNRHVQSRTDTP
jgi:hypothetical protein